MDNRLPGDNTLEDEMAPLSSDDKKKLVTFNYSNGGESNTAAIFGMNPMKNSIKSITSDAKFKGMNPLHDKASEQLSSVPSLSSL